MDECIRVYEAHQEGGKNYKVSVTSNLLPSKTTLAGFFFSPPDDSQKCATVTFYIYAIPPRSLRRLRQRWRYLTPCTYNTKPQTFSVRRRRFGCKNYGNVLKRYGFYRSSISTTWLPGAMRLIFMFIVTSSSRRFSL